MSRRTSILILAIAALAAIFFAIRNRADPATGDRPAAAAGEPAAPVEGAPGPSRSFEPLEPSAPAGPAPPTAAAPATVAAVVARTTSATAAPDATRISGTVTDEDGRPIEGASIVLVPTSKSPDAARKVASAADGAYAIEGVPPGAYRVSASDGAHADEKKRVTLAEGESLRLDLRLRAGATIAGHVRDPGGAPLGGILVRTLAPVRSATTGPDGAFELRGVERPTGSCILEASDPAGAFGKATKLTRIDGKPVEIVLRRAGIVSGHVAESPGAPIAGALVSIANATAGPLDTVVKPHEPVTTGELGEFALGGLSPGKYRLRAQREGLAPGSATVELREGATADVTIELDAGGAITGRVTDLATGSPLPGARIVDATDARSLGMMGPEAAAEISALSELKGGATRAAMDAQMGVASTAAGDDGRFSLGGLPAGARRIVAVAADHTTLTRTLEAVTGGEIPADFALATGGAIEGVARDATGAPLTGAVVTAMSPGAGMRNATVRDDGTYAIRGLRAGAYLVTLTLPREEDAPPIAGDMRSAQVKEGEAARVNFDARGAGAVLEGIVSGGGGQPLGQVMLLVPGERLTGARSAPIGPDGAFRIERVAPGTYDLMVGGTYHRTVVVPPGAPLVRADVALPSGTITGTVLAEDGLAPIAGAVVRATRRADQGDPLLRLYVLRATSDAGGRFTIEGVDAGEYSLEASATGFRRASAVASTATRTIELRLARGGTIRASVLGPDGLPVGDAMLMAWDAAGKLYTPSFDRVTPGAGSELALDGLPPGTYTVAAVSLRFAFARRTGVVFDGTELALELGLGPGGAIEVTCLDPAGAPLGGASAELRLGDGSPVPSPLLQAAFGASKSGADGMVRWERLAAGGYEGVVRAPDGRVARFTASVAEGATASVAARVGAQ